MRPTIRAIVLDFDGVLVVSEEIKAEAFKKLYSQYPEHLEPMMAHHRAHPSLSRVEKFHYLIRNRLHRGDDPHLLEMLLKSFSAEVRQRIAECPATPGSVEFLEEFSTQMPLYLASVTPVEDLEWILEKRSLRRYFKEVFGDPPIAKRDALLSVAGREECRPDQLLLIGDSEGDFIAARDAGTKFAGYQSGMQLPVRAKKFICWSELAAYLRGAVLTVS